MQPSKPELVRELNPNVRVITREDRERAAFRRLTEAIGALLQRDKVQEANEALRRYVKRGERDE